MALVLNTVQNYVDQARVLLQDKVVPYRYDDTTLVNALNDAVAEMARLRPDLVFKLMRSMNFPLYSSGAMSTAVTIDYRYRPTVLNYIVGFAQLADMEDTTDARSAAFMQAFTARLLSLQA